jgi:hypothetical protein
VRAATVELLDFNLQIARFRFELDGRDMFHRIASGVGPEKVADNHGGRARMPPMVDDKKNANAIRRSVKGRRPFRASK